LIEHIATATPKCRDASGCTLSAALLVKGVPYCPGHALEVYLRTRRAA
jgi:hypothetical protein